ncbi:MAG TPA: farnesyl diphosphate synthase [Gammaproteobacteria bacterium]|jgi:farnesyl diphosphate synthase|nr:farnesyl diphosphate synthase [Gammaproteobacteria bacterium]
MKTMEIRNLSLDEIMNFTSERLNHVYKTYLDNTTSLELKNAMEYSLLNGGKRLRPLLVYATGAIFNAPLENLDVAAAAVELIHTYSLIHDDLPCMDDAAMRRGRPACHKKFGEGMAVLAGDALLTLSMQVIASHPAPLKADRRVQMMDVLSQASGPYGMAAGQALDLTVMTDDSISTRVLEDIYRLKTGKLLASCTELGWLASKDDDENNLDAMRDYGRHVGLAFQIQDDILDIEGEGEDTGKPKNIDSTNQKFTYPKMHGIKSAKERIEKLYNQALEAINFMNDDAQILRELAKKMLMRKS